MSTTLSSFMYTQKSLVNEWTTKAKESDCITIVNIIIVPQYSLIPVVFQFHISDGIHL